MSRLTCFLVCLLQLFNFINSEGYYTISAPGSIRPNSEYHVAVSIHKSAEPCTVKVGIISPSYSNFKTVDVQPYSSELVQFDLPALVKDDYNLTVEGVSGIEFTNETRLDFTEKQYSVLIQTDKAIYKPGDLVRHRVLILDPHTKPAKIEDDIDVSIQDGKQNKIKLMKKVTLTRGVYSGELQLSSVPVLGDWQIVVDIADKTHTKTFEVAEYVLPKFEVTIDTDKHAVFKDGKIRATVRAKYTYGKPIVGEATVSVYPKTYGSFQPFVFDLITRKVVPLDGKAKVEFDIVSELKFTEDWQRDITIEAVVEEKLTGRKQNTTTTVTIHKHKYNIEAIKIPRNYAPGVPFEVKVKISHHDGSPVQDTTNPVTISLSKSYGQPKTNETEYYLDKDGIATFEMEFPESDEYFNIYAKYLDLEQSVGGLTRRVDSSGAAIQIEILTDNPSITGDVSVEVKSNKEMKYFVYHVAGRGDILLSRVVEVPNKKEHVFKFPANFAMAPTAKLFIYLIQDGDLVFDEKNIEFGEDLWNFVKIEAPTQASPGQDVDITVTTKPNSYVGLLGVDQSVLLLKSGNDLSHSSVFNELKQYDSTVPHMGGFGRIPGRDSGLVTLTNADYPYEKYPEIYAINIEYQYDGIPANAFDGSATAFGDSSSQPQVITTRKEFPESWIWDSLDTNDDGLVFVILISSRFKLL